MEKLKLKRLCAFIIDVFVVGMIMQLLLKLLQLTSLGIFVPCVLYAYLLWIFCKDCYNGQSLGKHWMKIQIIDDKTGKAVSPIKSVVRNLFYCIGLIEGFVLLCNPKGKRIGDYLCKTTVTESQVSQEPVNKRTVVATIIGVGVILFILGLCWWTMQNAQNQRMWNLLYS